MIKTIQYNQLALKSQQLKGLVRQECFDRLSTFAVTLPPLGSRALVFGSNKAHWLTEVAMRICCQIWMTVRLPDKTGSSQSQEQICNCAMPVTQFPLVDWCKWPPLRYRISWHFSFVLPVVVLLKIKANVIRHIHK